MFRLKDRGDRDMVLAMTHEEVFAWLASRELRSYRDLPQIWYQIQLKFRDEPRPKGGVLRVREFLMKDSYTFDVDEAGLERATPSTSGRTTASSSAAALSSIGSRATAASWVVPKPTSTWRPPPAGEDRVALCDSCGYAANVELARSVAPEPR